MVLLLSVGCESPNTSSETRPNIIIFFTDDQGYGDVGSYGASGFDTPNMDLLAENGIRFTDFYVTAPVCTPSRAGLLTGKYPKRVGLHEAVLYPFSEGGLSPKEYTIAKMLKDNGYTTSCIGKWHLGHLPEYMPGNHGFDYYYGVPYSNDMNNHYYKHNDFQSPPLPVFRDNEIIERDPDQRYLTKRYTEETIDRIKARGDSPFFIYLAHNMPHTPLYVSEDFEGKSELGLYGDVIMELDWSLGEIVKALKEEGIYDNTVLLFTSDNGPVTQVGGSSGPLRGRKSQTWEGGQRVPAIMSWPDGIPKGRICSEPVSTLDLLPTFANITQSELPYNLVIDGTDISSLLNDPEGFKLPERPFFYYSRIGEVEAVRLGDWKLHILKVNGWEPEHESDTFPVSLYNIRENIQENRNLVDEFPEKVSEMAALISDFKKNLE